MSSFDVASIIPGMSLLAVFKCGWALMDMKAACAAAADCVGFTRMDATVDAYATVCGFTVSQDTSMRHCEARCIKP